MAVAESVLYALTAVCKEDLVVKMPGGDDGSGGGDGGEGGGDGGEGGDDGAQLTHAAPTTQLDSSAVGQRVGATT